ncbi:MAG: hypothetical protein DCC67_15510 [Planctomycetota bacterium]|nr:MAG: hypothetical protein DCC67_15510 [Planctomycetota bacterium]
MLPPISLRCSRAGEVELPLTPVWPHGLTTSHCYPGGIRQRQDLKGMSNVWRRRFAARRDAQAAKTMRRTTPAGSSFTPGPTRKMSATSPQQKVYCDLREGSMATVSCAAAHIAEPARPVIGQVLDR